MNSAGQLRDIIDRNRKESRGGLYSICSAHPWVLEASMRQALEDGSALCVESTSNQVNQYGGYTGMTPAQFAEYLYAIGDRVGFPRDRILLGGDHLGPYPWRSEPAGTAMEKAAELVRLCVQAGYTKIHLDPSMACAGDPTPLADEISARRAAALCRVAEEARPAAALAPCYVVGTEVPVPGGEQETGAGPAITRPEDARRNLDNLRSAFFEQGLESAWERVIGLVVQPGVEFADAAVFEYDRAKARPLAACLPERPALVYEAHSTDYQTPAALRQMVEDHFAILKVGPALTFAFREAVFALAAIERECFGRRRGKHVSRIAEALEEAMLRNPEYWRPYYHGDKWEQRLARRFSYSDRSRYYWPQPEVQLQLEILLENLAGSVPLTLLSQYLPVQYAAVRAGLIQPIPRELIQDRVREVIRAYAGACDLR